MPIPSPPVTIPASLNIYSKWLLTYCCKSCSLFFPFYLKAKRSEMVRSLGLATVLLGVGPAVWEVYCRAVTSSLCDIFLGVDIQRGIGRRVRGRYILCDMWRERALRMGTKVFERAQGKKFAQNVTRTRYGGAALSYFTFYLYAMHQVESVSVGYKAVHWASAIMVRRVAWQCMLDRE